MPEESVNENQYIDSYRLNGQYIPIRDSDAQEKISRLRQAAASMISVDNRMLTVAVPNTGGIMEIILDGGAEDGESMVSIDGGSAGAV